MSVNAISSASTGSASGSSASATQLSQDTINKLKALGLDPTKYTSELQAKQAIEEAQEKQAPQKPNSKDSFSTLKTEAQDLASQMGVIVGNSDKISDIMDKISTQIDELQSSAGTDETKLSQVNDYNTQYTALSSELSQLQASQNMTGAMALANYNKAAFGLAA